ncbi:MAG: ABC transporter ATP-binding protein [Bifidobacterium sp.]|nr:ABC transporter ATP-binding protein [Bifidobacterium sp.]MCH4210121.1 ABC transporter ATP-binding protein [Bifidobacterium sp.]MCI1224859.1 ABC transporter ATP-binding protein [Bifidobacterium sp.]
MRIGRLPGATDRSARDARDKADVAGIRMQHIDKTYPGALSKALDDFNLDIRAGELVVLLGGSGCGKSTALRALAGLEDIQAGRIMVAGCDLTGVAANRRNMAMVFQAYSLFPHMTALQNIEFGLEVHGVGKARRRAIAQEKLELVGLGDQADKYTQQMSGGQQQRVALARALAVSPHVLLLDEPLSALDAKVRVQLRDEIRRIQLETGTTTLFVTHDQEEALAIADRIGVMNHGRIEQIDAPKALYQRPASEYVATFIGLTNRLPGDCDGRHAKVFGQWIDLLPGSQSGRARVVLVRPESLTLSVAGSNGADGVIDSHGAGGNAAISNAATFLTGVGVRARITMIHFLGALVRVDTVVASDDWQRWNGGEPLSVTVQLPENQLPAGIGIGSEVLVTLRQIPALAV